MQITWLRANYLASQALSISYFLKELLLLRTYLFLVWMLSVLSGGGYRSRTDDPLRARQML